MKIGIIALPNHDAAKLGALLAAIERAGHTHAIVDLRPPAQLTDHVSVAAFATREGVDRLIVVDNELTQYPPPPPPVCFTLTAPPLAATNDYPRRRDCGAVRNPCLPARFKKGSKQ